MTKPETVADYVSAARARLAAAVLAADDPRIHAGDVRAEITLLRQHTARLELAMMRRDSDEHPPE